MARLSICLLIVLSALSTACAAQSPEHPFRIQREQSDVPDLQPSKPIGNVLQGGVTKVDVRRRDNDVSTPLSGALREVLLNAQGEGLLDTPPIIGGAVGKSAPPSVYRGWLEKAHPQFSLSTSEMAEDRLVVVYGKYDDTGRTLSSFGLRHKTIQPLDLNTYDLSKAQVLVVDCPGGLTLQGMQKVRDFVARGGYLFTTDWLLDRLDAQIFPGYINWNGAQNTQKMYDAEVVGNDPELFKHAVTHAHWKIDIHCHVIRVLNKQAVKVLAVSRMLALDDPDRLGVLAVVFPFERGYVMHMIAHFDRSQKGGYYLPDPAPQIGISLRQAIATNFIVAGLSGTQLHMMP